MPPHANSICSNELFSWKRTTSRGLSNLFIALEVRMSIALFFLSILAIVVTGETLKPVKPNSVKGVKQSYTTPTSKKPDSSTKSPTGRHTPNAQRGVISHSNIISGKRLSDPRPASNQRILIPIRSSSPNDRKLTSRNGTPSKVSATKAQTTSLHENGKASHRPTATDASAGDVRDTADSTVLNSTDTSLPLVDPTTKAVEMPLVGDLQKDATINPVIPENGHEDDKRTHETEDKHDEVDEHDKHDKHDEDDEDDDDDEDKHVVAAAVSADREEADE